jgi:hypothetical protein
MRWLRLAIEEVPYKEGDLLITTSGIELEVVYANDREIMLKPVGFLGSSLTIPIHAVKDFKHVAKEDRE